VQLILEERPRFLGLPYAGRAPGTLCAERRFIGSRGSFLGALHSLSLNQTASPIRVKLIAEPLTAIYLARMQRVDGRAYDQLRPVSFELGIAPDAGGSVLVAMGNTRVICGVMVEENVPRWMKESRGGGITGGWLTAEYSMLPYSTQTRKPRDIAKGRLDGRSSEIQRLIGRSLRAVVDLEKLGPRTMWVDCDVLQADGGTRTAAITGSSLAVAIACRKLAKEKKVDAPPIRKLVAAVSAGMLEGNAIVDLSYEEDKAVTVDFNLVATEDGEFVEVQGSGEEATFSQTQLDELLVLARKGIAELIAAQRAVLARLMVAPPES
jgi:ribonuclease PH